MNGRILAVCGIVPRNKKNQLLLLNQKVSQLGFKADLFSPVIPSAERLLDDYKHLGDFEELSSNIEKQLLNHNYKAIIFTDPDSLNVYYRKISALYEGKIILFSKSSEIKNDLKKEIVLCSEPTELKNELFKKPEKKEKLTSIVMLTFNQLDLSKKCLDSLERFTAVPYELIIVDNGSNDGTVDFLNQYRSGKKNVRCIFNSENLAFSKANNQGIREAKGEYILLLNNDVILTGGWLKRMQKCLEISNRVGAAGPCTNVASGPQKISPGYEDLSELQNYSCAFAIKNAGRWINCHRLNAFCFIIKREVVEQVGLLDERFGPGGFEDYDYCLRIRQAGYKIMLAGDVYVHHIGGQGYEPNNMNYNDLRVVNKDIFINKWCKKALQIMEVLPDG